MIILAYQQSFIFYRQKRGRKLEFMSNLKKKGLNIKIPLIFLSAKGQVVDVEKGVSMNAYMYIVKPFLPTRLIAKVEEVFIKLAERKKLKDSK